MVLSTNTDINSVLDFLSTNILHNTSTCTFLMTKNKKYKTREDDLKQILLDNIINYVLDTNEPTQSVLSDHQKEKITIQRYRDARSFFITSLKQNTGEIGEMLLFMILETNGMPQVVSKMLLKTNPNLPYNGFDAIHVKYTNGEITYYLGESKMIKNFNTALQKSIESITDSLKNQKKIEYEINIIKKHIDKNRFGKEVSDELINALNPYTSDKKNLSYSYPIFIGCDWKSFGVDVISHNENFDEYVKKKYSKNHGEIESNIKEKINISELKNEISHFYILPFTNIEKFRTDFLGSL